MKIIAQGRYSSHLLKDYIRSLIAYLLLALIACTAATPLSAEIYKWVDENGKTHYSDTAHDEKAETVQIKNTPELDPGHDVRKQKQQRLLKVLDEERQQAKQQKAEVAAAELERKANCSKARKDLQNIQNASFLYKKSDDPLNPTVYSDEERAKIAEDAKKAVAHWCK